MYEVIFMTDEKLNKEEITNIFQNANIALQSISNVLPECSSNRMREELLDEYEGYQKFVGDLSKFMHEKGYEQKDVNVMKKAMLYTSVKINTLTDDSCSHIAEMMIKGTVMGITELKQLLTRADKLIDEDILKFANRLLNLEESYEKRLKTLL